MSSGTSFLNSAKRSFVSLRSDPIFHPFIHSVHYASARHALRTAFATFLSMILYFILLPSPHDLHLTFSTSPPPVQHQQAPGRDTDGPFPMAHRISVPKQLEGTQQQQQQQPQSQEQQDVSGNQDKDQEKNLGDKDDTDNKQHKKQFMEIDPDILYPQTTYILWLVACSALISEPTMGQALLRAKPRLLASFGGAASAFTLSKFVFDSSIFQWHVSVALLIILASIIFWCVYTVYYHGVILTQSETFHFDISSASADGDTLLQAFLPHHNTSTSSSASSSVSNLPSTPRSKNASKKFIAYKLADGISPRRFDSLYHGIKLGLLTFIFVLIAEYRDLIVHANMTTALSILSSKYNDVVNASQNTAASSSILVLYNRAFFFKRFFIIFHRTLSVVFGVILTILTNCLFFPDLAGQFLHQKIVATLREVAVVLDSLANASLWHHDDDEDDSTNNRSGNTYTPELSPAIHSLGQRKSNMENFVLDDHGPAASSETWKKIDNIASFSANNFEASKKLVAAAEFERAPAFRKYCLFLVKYPTEQYAVCFNRINKLWNVLIQLQGLVVRNSNLARNTSYTQAWTKGIPVYELLFSYRDVVLLMMDAVSTVGAGANISFTDKLREIHEKYMTNANLKFSEGIFNSNASPSFVSGAAADDSLLNTHAALINICTLLHIAQDLMEAIEWLAKAVEKLNKEVHKLPPPLFYQRPTEDNCFLEN